jgi:hypothetical protein
MEAVLEGDREMNKEVIESIAKVILRGGRTMETAQAILDLKYPTGEPMIGVLSREQELPDVLPEGLNKVELMAIKKGYRLAMEYVIKQGWRKVE